MRRSWRLAVLLLPSVVHAETTLPPSPYRLLAPRALVPAFLDVAPACRPVQPTEPVAAPESEGLAGAAGEPAGGRRPDPICSHLERARMSLGLGRVPEARVELRRAQRLARDGGFDAPTLEIVRFYRAEALVLEGDPALARPLFEELRAAASPRIALAAKLRLLDLELASAAAGSDTEALEAKLRARLDEAREANFDLRGWGPRVAELAIRGERLPEAQLWLAAAEEVEHRAGYASIRKADVLHALDRADDAARVLGAVRDGATQWAARELAQLRLAEYGLEPEDFAGRVASLREVSRSAHPSVTAQARDVLAELLLEAGEVGAALDELSKLGLDGAPDRAKPRFLVNLDRALVAAGAEELDCHSVLEHLGARRELYLRLGQQAAPLLRIGACYLELGMSEIAQEVYRSVARRFPIEPNRLPLRIATTFLALRDVPGLRAAVDARRAAGTSDADDVSWIWLEANLRLLEEEPGRAAARLVSLLGRDDLPDDLRVAAEQRLGAVRGGDVDGIAQRKALLRSLGRPVASRDAGEQRGSAWLHAGDLLAGQGREQAALAAYLRATELLPEGSRRDRARLAAALREGSPARERAVLAREGADMSSPWASLADLERRMIELRVAARSGETP